MKLSICLLLAVVAAASSDQGFYQQRPVAQSASSNQGFYQPQPVAAASADQGFYQPQPAAQSVSQAVSSPSNYHDYDYPPQEEGWLDRLLESNRRQGIAGIFAFLTGLGVGPIIAIVFVGVIVITIIFFVGTALSSSGRGLDTDEWEVDNSVWINQLQEDFEDSWEGQ